MYISWPFSKRQTQQPPDLRIPQGRNGSLAPVPASMPNSCTWALNPWSLALPTDLSYESHANMYVFN